MYSPLFGVSNAYFLTQPPPLKTILENASNNSPVRKSASDETKSNFSSTPSSPALPDHLIKDIPNLLSQVVYQLISVPIFEGFLNKFISYFLLTIQSFETPSQ
jgi:hypothetical protein